MVTVSVARDHAAGVFSRRFARWMTYRCSVASAGIDTLAAGAEAASPGQGGLADAVISLPLHPPAQDYTASHMQQVADWVQQWRAAEQRFSLATIRWEERSWAALGRQLLPVRLDLDGPEAIAQFAGELQRWDVALARGGKLVHEITQTGAPFTEEATTQLARIAAKLTNLSDADAARHRAILRWFIEHPDSGLYARQVPVRGVDTKWLEQHRGLIEPLLGAITGGGTGLVDKAAKQRMVRVRFLDPSLAPGGLDDIAAPVETLGRLDIRPDVVIGVENLETLMSLEPMPGAVAVWGQGYAYENAARLPWLARSRVLYWGDLDSHGFNILGLLRRFVPQAESVLMDLATLTEFEDLCVVESSPFRPDIANLTPTERAALHELRVRGDLRLEQERIPWAVCRAAIRSAVGTPNL